MSEPELRQGLLDGTTERVGPALRAKADLPREVQKSVPQERPDAPGRLALGHAYRLIGPPGCGKTTALATRWVPRAVERFGAEGVVVCSLTRTAAAEIASRGVGLPQENVGTLHSLAFRALGRPTIAQDSKVVAAWNESCPPAHRLTPSSSGRLEDGETDLSSDREFRGDELLEIAERFRHRCAPIESWPAKARQFYLSWRAWKRERDVLDFTDLIDLSVEFSATAPGEPQVLIVDEAQDLSALEMRLVNHWGAACEFFVLAGDGDQSIYAWRGADAAAFMSSEVASDRVFTLDQSYRVPRTVQRYAARWIDKVRERYPVEYAPKDDEGECRIDRGMSLRKTPKLLREIERDLEQGREVMVLATCAFMLRTFIRDLRRRGLAFHNPYRLTNGAWNPMRGGVSRLRAFLEPFTAELQGDEPEVRLWSWEELRRWIEPLKVGPDFVRGVKTRVKERASNARLEGPVTRTEMREVLTDAGWSSVGAAFSAGGLAPLDWYRERLLVTHRKRFEYALKMAAKRGVGALAEKPRLIVGTVHSVKGGGADSVYLAPDLSLGAAKEYSRKGASRDGVIRTFYVGMTRAKAKLVLLGGSQANAAKWLPITTPEE